MGYSRAVMVGVLKKVLPPEARSIVEVSREKEWEAYENIQSDIFDHVLAVIPEFELRVFQNPTGADFKLLAKTPD